MKKLALHIITLLFLSGISFSQNKTEELLFYKSFDDSVFHVGDLILCKEIRFPLVCKPYVEDEIANNINYQSYKEIADFMNRFPKMKIEIGIHTDTRGSEDANLKLSLNRAIEIVSYLEKYFNISLTRLIPKGYGESKPIYTEKYINQFKEDKAKFEQLHQVNRRVVLKILEI